MQEYLSGFEGLASREFGGTRVRGNARQARPVAVKRPMHLVMRSSHARGLQSFLRRRKQIESIIRRQARDVRVYRVANAGNHLHLIVMPRTREAYSRFIRSISGLIARVTLGVERGRARGERFWDALPFTRVLDWGRDYRNACRYLLQNTLEALGFIAYQPRKARPP